MNSDCLAKSDSFAKNYSFAHLANQSVLREYDAIESQENADTATALALLGEIDARRLYVGSLVQCAAQFWTFEITKAPPAPSAITVGTNGLKGPVENRAPREFHPA